MLKILFLAVFCYSVAYGDSDCKLVTFQGNVVKETEKREYCFLNSETYFISRNCQSLNCKFIEKLKRAKFKHSENSRPGISMCVDLGGAVEEVTIMETKTKTFRCLFSEDATSVSLNLLESWNGKKFTGPGRPVKF